VVTAEEAATVRELFRLRELAKTPEEKTAISYAIHETARGRGTETTREVQTYFEGKERRAAVAELKEEKAEEAVVLSEQAKKESNVLLKRSMQLRAESAMSVVEAKPFHKLSVEYKTGDTKGIVPEDIKQQIEVPPSVAAAGATAEYQRLSYEAAIGVKTEEQVHREFGTVMQQKISDMPDVDRPGGEIWWYKQYGTFGEEGEKTWVDIEREVSDADIEIKEGKPIIVTPMTSREQLLKVMTKEYEETPYPAARAGTVALASLFDPRTYYAFHVKGGGIYGGIKAAEEAKAEVLKFEYPITKKEGIEKWWGIAEPAYMNIVIPFAAGTLLKPVLGAVSMFGTKVGGFTGTVISKALPTYFAVTVPVAVGTDIGVTAAYEKAGLYPEGETIIKAARYGLQFTMFGLGAKYSPLTAEQVTAKLYKHQE